jgi:hypothetical protein
MNAERLQQITFLLRLQKSLHKCPLLRHTFANEIRRKSGASNRFAELVSFANNLPYGDEEALVLFSARRVRTGRFVGEQKFPYIDKRLCRNGEISVFCTALAPFSWVAPVDLWRIAETYRDSLTA